jgi:hypothetical protein
MTMPNEPPIDKGESSGDASPVDQLLSLLRPSDEIDIFGVVDACGVSAGQSRGEVMWRLCLPLVAWRTRGEPIQNMNLTVTKDMTKAELDSTFKKISPYDVVHLKARLADGSDPGNPRVVFVGAVEIHVSDQELNKRVRELQEPVILDDVEFGRFILDRRVNWFETKMPWGSTMVKLCLPMDGCDDAQASLAQARQLWKSQLKWNQQIIGFAVSRLLGLKNEAWLDENEDALSAEQFRNKMVLDAIVINADGHFQFWYNDGDLFGGHSIMVEGSITDGPKEAGIHG